MMNMLLGVLLLLACAQTSSTSRHSPPPRSYNVLILTPMGSRSHQALMMPIAEALADRGHQVTMLANYGNTPTRPNITVLTHGLKHGHFEQINILQVGRNPIESVKLFSAVSEKMGRELYQTPVVAELYRRKDDFDVVIIDFFFNELVYPFAVGKPFITASVSGNDPVHSMSFGNMLNPAYFSHSFHHYLSPLSVWERIENLIIILAIQLLREWITFAAVQNHISRQFPDLPSLAEIERNQSVAFLNTHFSVASPPEPLLPGQVEIGGIQCREGRPLPQDIMNFLSTDVPVILLSFGTAVSPKFMSEGQKKMFISSFSKLPYRIICNFDGVFQNVSSNVMMKNWLPQQDIMAHPNVKLFITHGGLFGILEAVYHATPMLVMPVYCDQPKNAMRIQNLGIGLTLSWDDVTEEQITESIKKIISEPKYQEEISELSVRFKERPDTPSELVVYWTEFSVRHGRVMRRPSPENDLSQIQLLHLDVFALLCLALYIWYKIIMLLVMPLMIRLLKLYQIRKNLAKKIQRKMD